MWTYRDTISNLTGQLERLENLAAGAGPVCITWIRSRSLSHDDHPVVCSVEPGEDWG
jgi:hypothetical protein